MVTFGVRRRAWDRVSFRFRDMDRVRVWDRARASTRARFTVRVNVRMTRTSERIMLSYSSCNSTHARKHERTHART